MSVYLIPTFSEYSGTQEEKQIIEEWYSHSSRSFDFSPSGTRSVFIHLSPHYDLKIKGAGFPPDYHVHFRDKHCSGPKAFRFDYEGRRMLDLAIGHDTACKGGMSYQQASVEYLAAAKFSEFGYDVVPCVGWGSVRGSREDEISFFAVLRWNPKIIRANKRCQADLRLELLKRSAELLVNLHLNHCVSTYFAVGMLENRDIIYDLHPTRLITEMTDSPISASMQMIYNLRVRWWALKTYCNFTEEVETIKFADEVFRAVLPDMTFSECRSLENDVIIPILTSNGPKDYADSLNIMNSNRLSQHLMSTFHSILR